VLESESLAPGLGFLLSYSLTPSTTAAAVESLLCRSEKCWHCTYCRAGMGKVRPAGGPRIPFVRPADSSKRDSMCDP